MEIVLENTPMFEGKVIRTGTLIETGEFCFVAQDVADALAYSRTDNMMKYLDADERGTTNCSTPFGVQIMSAITQSGLYHLLRISKKDKVKPFGRWLDHEVLPSIQEKGYYGINTQVGKIEDVIRGLTFFKTEMVKIGVSEGVAMACTINSIEQNTGIAMDEQRKALPNRAEVELPSLNAGALGSHLNMSAREANALLLKYGFQFKNERGDWTLTDAGKQYGEAHPYNKHGHSGYQILWKPSVINVLQGHG